MINIKEDIENTMIEKNMIILDMMRGEIEDTIEIISKWIMTEDHKEIIIDIKKINFTYNYHNFID